MRAMAKLNVAAQMPRNDVGFGTDSAEIVYDTKSDELHITSKHVGLALTSSTREILGATLVVFFASDRTSPASTTSVLPDPSDCNHSCPSEPDDSQKRWEDVPMSLSFLPLPPSFTTRNAESETAPLPCEDKNIVGNSSLERHESGLELGTEDSFNPPLLVSFGNLSNSELQDESRSLSLNPNPASFSEGDAVRCQSDFPETEEQDLRTSPGAQLSKSGNSKQTRYKSKPLKRPLRGASSASPGYQPESCESSAPSKKKSTAFPSSFGIKEEPKSPAAAMYGEMEHHMDDFVSGSSFLNRLLRGGTVTGRHMENAKRDETGDNDRLWQVPAFPSPDLGYPVLPPPGETSRPSNSRKSPASARSSLSSPQFPLLGEQILACQPPDLKRSIMPGTEFKLREEYLTASPIPYDKPNMRKLFAQAVFSKRRSCKCLVCQEDIVNHDGFIHHSSVHQGKGKGRNGQECPVCRKVFAQPRGLYKHMSVHVTKDLYACPLCTNHYSRMEKFKLHFTQNHPAQSDLMDDFIKLYTTVFRQCIRYQNLFYRFESGW